MQPRFMSRGFTLIELLIVVAIVGILSVIATSSYQDAINKSQRADAQQLLLAIANREELYLLDAASYTNSFTSLNFTSDGWDCTTVPTICENDYYNVDVTPGVGAPPSYTITATPVAGSAQVADGILTLDSTGAKTRNGVAGW